MVALPPVHDDRLGDADMSSVGRDGRKRLVQPLRRHIIAQHDKEWLWLLELDGAGIDASQRLRCERLLRVEDRPAP